MPGGFQGATPRRGSRLLGRAMPQAPLCARAIAAELTVPDRVLLFCLASDTDWMKARVTQATAQHMLVRNLVERGRRATSLAAWLKSRGRLGRPVIGIPLVPDPHQTTGATEPFLGVALRFKAPKGECMAVWKARLYTPCTPYPSRGIEGDLIRGLGHTRQYAPCLSRWLGKSSPALYWLQFA